MLIATEVPRNSGHPQPLFQVQLSGIYCYQRCQSDSMLAMRQVITRIDDELHARLKRQAAAEGRSVNALVVDALRALTSDAVSPRDAVRTQAEQRDVRVAPPPPRRQVPSRRTVANATRGAGRVASKALTAERAAR